MITPLVLLALLSLQGIAGARTYSIASLRARFEARGEPPYGGFIARPGEEPVDSNPFFAGAAGDLSTAAILELLRATIEGAPPELDLIGDSLVVRATEEQHRALGAALRDLDAALARPIRVDVLVVSLPPESKFELPAVLAAADVDRSLAALSSAGRVLWSSVVDAATGQIAEAGYVQRRPYVADFKTEVAKKSSIAAPVVAQATGGVRVTLLAVPATGGERLHLTALASFQEVRSVLRYDTRARDVGAIEIPKIAGARLAATAVIPADGALVLRGESEDLPPTVVVLRPRGEARHDKIGGALLTATPLLLGPTGRALPMLGDELGVRGESSPLPTPPLAELLRASAAGAAVQGIGSGRLLVTGDEGAQSRALAAIRGFEDPELRAVPFTVRVVRAADAASALAPEAKAVAAARLVATARRSAGAIVGVEEATVTGYDVMVAEESKIADPRVRSVFRGLVVRARALEADDAGGLLEIDVRFSDFGPRERVVSELDEIGDHEGIPSSSGGALRRVALRAGAPLLLGDLGPSSGGGRLFATLAAR